MADCQKRGWREWCFLVNIGVRGFVRQLLRRALTVIGVTRLEIIAHRATEQGGRNGIAVVMEKKRRTVGKTARDNCAIKIGTQADNWMVPVWELITLVGAPLDVVVDRLKQPRKEEPPDDGIITHRNHQDVYRYYPDKLFFFFLFIISILLLPFELKCS